jgi:hypothetical protein
MRATNIMEFSKVTSGHYYHVDVPTQAVIHIKKRGTHRWYSHLIRAGWEKDVLSGIHPTLAEAKQDAPMLLEEMRR